MSRMALRTFAGPSWKSWTRRANRLRGRMPACLRAGRSMSVTPPGCPGSRRRRRLVDRALDKCLPQFGDHADQDGGADADPPVLELEVGGVEESLQRSERRRQEDGEERGPDRDEQRLVGEGVEVEDRAPLVLGAHC